MSDDTQAGGRPEHDEDGARDGSEETRRALVERRIVEALPMRVPAASEIRERAALRHRRRTALGVGAAAATVALVIGGVSLVQGSPRAADPAGGDGVFEGTVQLDRTDDGGVRLCAPGSNAAAEQAFFMSDDPWADGGAPPELCGDALDAPWWDWDVVEGGEPHPDRATGDGTGAPRDLYDVTVAVEESQVRLVEAEPVEFESDPNVIGAVDFVVPGVDPALEADAYAGASCQPEPARGEFDPLAEATIYNFAGAEVFVWRTFDDVDENGVLNVRVIDPELVDGISDELATSGQRYCLTEPPSDERFSEVRADVEERAGSQAFVAQFAGWSRPTIAWTLTPQPEVADEVAERWPGEAAVLSMLGPVSDAVDPETEDPAPAELDLDDPVASEAVVFARGSVLDAGRGAGPQLCKALKASLPPQCTGLEMSGWSWPETAEQVGGVRWVEHANLRGVWDGSVFTVFEVLQTSADPDWGYRLGSE